MKKERRKRERKNGQRIKKETQKQNSKHGKGWEKERETIATKNEEGKQGKIIKKKTKKQGKIIQKKTGKNRDKKINGNGNQNKGEKGKEKTLRRNSNSPGTTIPGDQNCPTTSWYSLNFYNILFLNWGNAGETDSWPEQVNQCSHGDVCVCE